MLPILFYPFAINVQHWYTDIIEERIGWFRFAALCMIMAFGNKARVGKDTACDYLVEKYGARKVRIAGPLYEQCSKLKMYIDGTEVYGGMTEKDAPLLIWWGEQRRKEDPAYWAKTAFDAIAAELASFGDKDGMIVIPDVRLLPETKMREMFGAIMVRINYVGDRIIDRDPMARSEIELDNFEWDYQIHNVHGDRTKMYESIETILSDSFGATRLAALRERGK